MQFILSLLMLFNTTIGDPDEKPFILVELFTSEGCSSCPPADQLLSEIVDKNYEDVNVIGLSFHVDYWDYIGWKDPYASQQFTQRQRTYARKFYSNQIYTPQMVVNGRHEFVGSSKSKWLSAFNKLKSKKLEYSIDLNGLNIVNEQVIIEVSSTYSDNVVLNVAIVEKDLSQQVSRGENRGRKLLHDNVVRVFKTRQFDGQPNRIRMDLPEDIILSNSSLVLYAQHEKSWKVVHALSTPLVTE